MARWALDGARRAANGPLHVDGRARSGWRDQHVAGVGQLTSDQVQ